MSKIAHKAEKFSFGAIVLYVLFIVIWLILRLLLFDRLWWLSIINDAAIYIFVPLPIMLTACLWKRRWRLLAGLSIPILAFGVLFGELFLPQLPYSLPEGGRMLAVMTFNVFTGNKNYQAIAGVIRAVNPDIVGLQELNQNTARKLVQELAVDYPYHAIMPPNQKQQVGIFSRFPIVTATTFSLPTDSHALQAVVRVYNQQIHILVADLLFYPKITAQPNQVASLVSEYKAQKLLEIKHLEQEFRKTGDPVLLLCDCNLTSTSEAYTQLKKFALDSFWQAGWGLGHTVYVNSAIPVQRIDYIWHSDEFAAIEAVVGSDSAGSDHLPAIAKLWLQRPN